MKLQAHNRSALTKAQLALSLQEQREVTIMTLQLKVTYFLLALFALNGLCVLAIVFFQGFGKMDLPQSLIMTLIAETVAQAASIFFIVIEVTQLG